MELSPQVCSLIQQTANSFSGSQRRRYMAGTSSRWPSANARPSALRLGTGHPPQGPARTRTGLTCQDATSCRGRKPVEFHLPHLLDDIKDIVQDHFQTDPTFQTTRLYCRLTAPEVRRQLIARKGYTDEQLPSVQDDHRQAHRLGLPSAQGGQVPPPKKVKETDAIFANVKEVHQQAAPRDTLRLSLDSKATVLIGPFSRGGHSRTGYQGVDHDFKPEGTLTPFGIFRAADVGSRTCSSPTRR